jgi:ribose transport system permease protein
MKTLSLSSIPRGAGLFGALVVLVVVASFVSPHFFNTFNLLNVMRQVAMYGVLGVAMTFVILTKGIDLSVGSTVALAGVSGALLMEHGWPLWLMVLACLALGVVVGAVNGFGIAISRIPAFIMTLGTMVMVRGVGLILADGGTVNPGAAGDAFFFLGGGYIAGIPTPIYVFAIVCIVSYVLLGYTAFGRAIYAVGSNEEAARLSGINVRFIIFAVYAICGFLSALAGLIFLSRLSVGDPNSGLGLELEAITIAVIGGTSLFGGEGTVLGTVGGAMVLAIIANVLNLAGVSPFSQQVVKGAIIILAVLLEGARKLRK